MKGINSKFSRVIFQWKSVSGMMSLRTALTAMFIHHCTGLAKGYTRLQKCSFYVHFQSSKANSKNLDSQNLKLITTTWVQRLKEDSVPEAELSVNIILDHILGRDRMRVCLCHVNAVEWLRCKVSLGDLHPRLPAFFGMKSVSDRMSIKGPSRVLIVLS